MIRSDLYAERSEGVLQEGLEAAESPLWLVNPTWDDITQLVSLFREPRPPLPPSTVRLFAEREPLRRLTDDFLLAAVAAELVDDGTLELRTLEAQSRQSLLLTENSVVSLVACRDGVAGLTTTRDGFVRAAYEEYTARWEDTEPFSLRTPPLSETRATLEAELGPAVLEDFDRVLELLDAEHAADRTLDEVTIVLLVAANNGELLYDISRWGEEICLASKATFSRTKTELEEAGLIDTEKVPIEVGRPRLRLVPGDSSVDGGGIEALTRHARAKLG